MSVKGEFLRILDDAIAQFRAQGSDRAESLAKDLEAARDAAAEDLSRVALRVLELCAEHPPEQLEGGAELADAGERMLAVARMVLGR